MVSVLIPVYKRERPECFNLAMESIYNQTLADFEVVLVVDGPLTKDLYTVLHKWEKLFGDKIKVVYLEKNMGVATALNEGLKHCSFDLVARMDSDDYSELDRLELQYNFMVKHPDIDVVGSYVAEFIENKDAPVMIKSVPVSHEDIVNSMWSRNPMNHPTVMYRKQSVLAVGGYEPFFGDDDHLWAKMCVAGHKFYNMSKCLLRMRVGAGKYRRRGIKWLVKDFRVKKYLFRNGKMNLFQFIFILSVLLVIRLIPTSVRKLLYSKIPWYKICQQR
jgi:glycosyltransferase involved in cell wall biosynthesis